MPESKQQYPPVPMDDPGRTLTFARLDGDDALPHIGIAGDTYTITVPGDRTNGRFCVIEMHIPPGGGPPPHRHNFEETFILLEGEMEVTFRGQKTTARAGDTVNVPSNAPHRFHNVSTQNVRLVCIASPAGLDKFFEQLGVPVATRTTAPPKLDEAQQRDFIDRAKALAPQYGTELLREA